MSIIKIQGIGDDPTLEDVVDAYERMRKMLDWLLNGNVDFKNIQAEGITAKNVKAGSIETDKLAAGAVTADKITVAELSAISADIGTITAGSITTNAEINVGTDARIGNILYLKETDSSGTKGVVFSTVTGSSAKISVLTGDLAMTMSGFMTISPGSSQGLVVNSKVTGNSLHSGNGYTGTVYVAGTPGGPTDIILYFVDGIAVM